MEAAAVLAFLGLGYTITKLSGNTAHGEGFQSNAQRGPTSDPLTQSARGAAPRASQQEMDLMFRNLMGAPPAPGEPVPGIRGTLVNYSPPPMRAVPMNPNLQPKPEPIDSATPDVALNPIGIETAPNYMSEDYIMSPLTGEKIPSADYTHNNMVPFFGGRVRQNVAPQTNSGILDSFWSDADC